VAPGPEPEPVFAAASPGNPDLDFALEDDLDPPAGATTDDEIEVFEVVSPPRRRLARAGSR
jgi:hypothetical protein